MIALADASEARISSWPCSEKTTPLTCYNRLVAPSNEDASQPCPYDMPDRGLCIQSYLQQKWRGLSSDVVGRPAAAAAAAAAPAQGNLCEDAEDKAQCLETFMKLWLEIRAARSDQNQLNRDKVITPRERMKSFLDKICPPVMGEDECLVQISRADHVLRPPPASPDSNRLSELLAGRPVNNAKRGELCPQGAAQLDCFHHYLSIYSSPGSRTGNEFVGRRRSVPDDS